MLFASASSRQIVFLVAVENPHIDRTYGSSEQTIDANRRVLYDPQTGLFPDKKDAVLLVDVDPFRASDLALLVFVVYGLTFALMVQDKRWAVAQAVLWRCGHWLGLGGVLWRQAKSQFWTSHFTQRGRSLYEAFENWKRIYNLSLTMNLVVFIGAAIRYFEWPEEGNWDMYVRLEMSCLCLVRAALCLAAFFIPDDLLNFSLETDLLATVTRPPFTRTCAAALR